MHWISKIFLADLPSEKIDAILPKKLEEYTPNTITKKADLIQELIQVKTQGYAMDNEEFERGLLCIALPVYNQEGKLLSGVSISGSKHRFDFNQLEEYVTNIKTY